MFSFQVNSVSDYAQIFKQLECLLIKNKIVLLTGDLGVGKTTFVKEYLKSKYCLSDSNLVKLGYSSPTFTIQNQYEVEKDLILHFDFYRVGLGEYDIEDDIDTILKSSVTFIEWPEKISAKQLLVDYSFLEIEFTLESDFRKVVLKS